LLKILRLLFSRQWWWVTLIALVGIGVTIRLGFWQLDRHSKRQAEISHLQAVQAMPILDLNAAPLQDDLASMEYRQVAVTGEYDFQHQIALRNQVVSGLWGNDPGYALITPLRLSDGRSVLVQRGWIPLDYNTPDSWVQFNEDGIVKIEGIIRLSLEKGETGSALLDPTLSPGETRLDYWNNVNLARLQEQIPYPILNIYIQQAPGEDPESLPYRSIEKPDLDPGDHISFALQWFFYSGVLLIGYPLFVIKQEQMRVTRKNSGS
jgi:surfeit locus 1 family protein